MWVVGAIGWVALLDLLAVGDDANVGGAGTVVGEGGFSGESSLGVVGVGGDVASGLVCGEGEVSVGDGEGLAVAEGDGALEV